MGGGDVVEVEGGGGVGEVAVGERGTTLPRQRAPRSCTVFVMTPPNEHTSEGGRDDRGVPYHAESTLSSAQVLKVSRFDTEVVEREYHHPRSGARPVLSFAFAANLPIH